MAYNVCPFVALYANIRNKYGQWLLFIVMIVIAFLSVKESFLGLSQLLGHRASNNYLFAITGSFDNPGPYGGFLAVCVSVIGAYALSNNLIRKTRLLFKVIYWMSSAVALLGLVIIPSTQSRTAILALVCSMSLFAFGAESIRIKIKPIFSKYGIWILSGSIALITCAYLFKKSSADGRIFIDRISIMAMCDNGIMGAGKRHFAGAYGTTQGQYFQNYIEEKGKDDLDWTAISEHERLTAGCPDNAFNEYLFIGVEYGPFAMFLFIAVIVSAIILSFKRRTIWCYGMTAFAVFSMFSYPLHVTQFQILFPILLVACFIDGIPNSMGLTQIILLTVALITLLTVAYKQFSVIRYRKPAEVAWEKVKRWHQMEYYVYVVEDCDSLLPYMQTNQQFLFAYGQSLNKTGNYAKSDSILKLGTEISSDPMFWNVMGNNSLALGNYREAEARYKHAFYMVPNRLYPLTLLAKLYHAEGDTVRFLNMTEKVETFVPKIENANTKRLREEIRDIKAGYTNNRKLTDE